MADPLHLKMLLENIDAWNQWRRKEPWITPDLREANLSGAMLQGANLIQADLLGADLSGADLFGAILGSTSLIGINLRKAMLAGADLMGANLSRADLGEADLIAANLSGANLSGANLSRAKLMSANLVGADLAEANLSGAVMKETVLANVDLGEVNGLEAVEHFGPSFVGIDTFFASKGRIPEIFLRGAGVPEIFIQYSASLLSAPIGFYSCFISYSQADKPFARRLHDSLQGRGVRCWLDETHLMPGDDIQGAIDEGVRLWDKVLLCCSESSMTSWWVDKEFRKALQKEEALWKKRGKQVLAIIPLNLDGYILKADWTDWKKQHLTDRVAADFTGWDKDNAKFEEELGRLLTALRTDVGAREQPPRPLL